ncbi:MAG: hypothetical protein CR988_06290 [Treponema sp.]|nr:MAG: hypothetical protein CR988_06290 [Treponema sp.]
MEDCKLVLKPQFKNISHIEKLMRTSPNIDDDKRNAALIISTEFFDNIVEHAVSPDDSFITITVSKRERTRITFSYQTSNFQELINGVRRSRPHYNSEAGRYRGMGLRMTRYLASHIVYNDDKPISSIVVYL